MDATAGVTVEGPPAFVIHLARATKRAALVDRIRAALPFPVEVLQATDGAELQPDERMHVAPTTPLHRPRYPFRLSAGEVGCFLSHRRLWDRMIAESMPEALILEDDVEIDPEPFAAALALARAEIGRVGYVQFQVRPLDAKGEVVAETGGVSLHRLPLPPLRMSAQLVSLDAARALRAASDRFDRPVDTFIQMHWVHGVHAVCAVPSGVRDRTVESGGSTIQRKPPLREKLWREWARFRYRRAVARRARG